MEEDMKLRKFIATTISEFLTEQYYNISDETQWMWVSPNNNIIKVPKLNHKDYIMRQYKNTDIGWDYDKVFDKAIEDGWVRVIYEKFPSQYKGELSINGYNKERVKYVLKNVFWDLIRFGNKTIYVDYENPKESNTFSTFSSESKSKLIDFLN
jgi:hypothetical protein